MSLRISSGRLKGRTLSAPAGIRPTESRVREAFFDALGAGVEGLRFLDLFAGSGAMGLEAWSRGAKHVTWVDSNRRWGKCLEEVARSFGVFDSTFVTARLPEQWDRLPDTTPWDVVFADPPYDFGAYGPLLESAATAVVAGGIVCVEHRRRVELPDERRGLVKDDERGYGVCSLSYYSPSAPGSPRVGSVAE
jgi:16S rRNA (guanine966-N2)-methyltransferase